ncbi:branched-chain amino acid ABC transporter permease [Tsukamurella soli]|uniref:Branched-chain amino acid ABC transporter permease n=1 Tax=Tsukamurella soli TaxID=644556 RepID=A0ABP8J0M8_9ACTN
MHLALIVGGTAHASSIQFNPSGLLHGFWGLTVEGLTWGAIYALVAVGYTLVYGVLKLINFAHSEVFMVGMFGQYVALLALGFTPNGNAYNEGLVTTIGYLIVAGLAAMVTSGLVALGLERVAYRPLRRRGAKPLVFLITAIGMSFVLQEIVQYVLPNLNTTPTLGGSSAQPGIALVSPVTEFTVFGAAVRNTAIVIIISALVLAALVDVLINRTGFGRAIRAVAQDPDAATLMGVSRERVIMLTFLLGGVLAGAAAILYATWQTSAIIYNGGFLLGIKAFTAAVLGGIGNVRGALLGGLLLGVFENYGAILFGNQWKDVIAFVLLVLVLMIRPSGLLGEKLGRARA